ncbi:hypothetical protein SLA2020_204700 [Shorea laevis]
MGEWNNGDWSWVWRWRRGLFAWETDMLQVLQYSLANHTPKLGKDDHWIWRHDLKGCYTVASAYKLLSSFQCSKDSKRFRLLWNTTVPLKVAAFAWKALQGRIPTVDNLTKRGLRKDMGDGLCALCGVAPETAQHLLFKCKMAWGIWTACYEWWGIQLASQEHGWIHLEQHEGLFQRKNIRKIWVVL